MSFITEGIFGGGDAAREAAQAQVRSSELAQGEIRRQFDATQESLSPFREAGTEALSEQQALLGLSGQQEQDAAFESFRESPGQRFIRNRAQKELLRGASALGGIGGGNIRSALVEQGAGFAAQDFNNQFNRLQNLSGQGQAAATNVGQFGQTTAANIGNLQVGAGAAEAQGILQEQQAKAGLAGQFLNVATGGIAGATGILGPNVGAGRGAALALVSDKNLKRDVRALSPKECYDKVCGMKLKAWKYMEELDIDSKEHFGVMAQDAPREIKIDGREALNLHDELSLIAGAIQHMKENQLCLLAA